MIGHSALAGRRPSFPSTAGPLNHFHPPPQAEQPPLSASRRLGRRLQLLPPTVLVLAATLHVPPLHVCRVLFCSAATVLPLHFTARTPHCSLDLHTCICDCKVSPLFSAPVEALLPSTAAPQDPPGCDTAQISPVSDSAGVPTFRYFPFPSFRLYLASPSCRCSPRSASSAYACPPFFLLVARHHLTCLCHRQTTECDQP